jgi:hypothetical protein
MGPAKGEVMHVVLFKWKPEATPEQIERVMEALRELPEKIPGIRELTCGENFCERAQGFQHGLVVRFADRAALDAYGPHPAHQEVVQSLILPLRESVLALDYEI